MRDVDDVWTGDWSRRPVVVLPRSQQDMATLIGSDGKGLSQIAAVTTGSFESGLSPGRPHRHQPRRLGHPRRPGPAGGAHHEMTHVATRSISVVAPPIWLSEGFADYVAYQASPVPTAVVASDVLDDVRDGEIPRTLPTGDDFDASHGDISAAYEGAWLACRMIAERYGEKKLVALYAAVTDSSGAGYPEEIARSSASASGSWCTSGRRTCATRPLHDESDGAARADRGTGRRARGAGHGARPWRPLPLHGLPRRQADPARDFTAAQMAREDAYHAALRSRRTRRTSWAWSSPRAGADPAGARLVGWVAAPFGGGWLAGRSARHGGRDAVGRLLVLPWMPGRDVHRRYGLSTQTGAAGQSTSSRGTASGWRHAGRAADRRAGAMAAAMVVGDGAAWRTARGGRLVRLPGRGRAGLQHVHADAGGTAAYVVALDGEKEAYR